MIWYQNLQQCNFYLGDTKRGKTTSIVKAKGKNNQELANEICNVVSDKIITLGDMKVGSLEDHAKVATSNGLKVDESVHECEAGKKFATTFIQSLGDLANKKDVLPLQGDLWRKWSEHDKEEKRRKLMGATSADVYADNIRTEKKRCRKQQAKTGLSSQMKEFHKILDNSNEEVKKYFIAWCQFKLNELSEKRLKPIHDSHSRQTLVLSAAGSAFETAKKMKTDVTEKKKKLEEEQLALKTIVEEMKDASIGIEHLMRELGQFYECSYKNHKTDEDKNKLPNLMVDLLLMGVPLEIMDGDVSNVPLEWILAVFKCLKERLGDCRIFVESILGIQSSGKSTLLNTMHGLKFAVSSGRCTRGAYMQLIPVKDEDKDKIGCDYYFVVDSEGLRSPELGDMIQHDNELATFVSCLASTTILNLWGQTFNKDIEDVIQIATFAYIRMKAVKLKGSYHIVFVGVPDVTAKEKNASGVANIFEKFNTMAVKAATANRPELLEHGKLLPLLRDDCKGIQEFFPALWTSSMSIPNAKYGELIEDLRDNIVSIIRNKSMIQPLRISQLSKRIEDVWNAVKKEDFIFGFRNSLEVDVYADFSQFQNEKKEEVLKKILEKASIIEINLLNKINENQEVDYFEERELEKLAEEEKSKINIELKSFVKNSSQSDLAKNYLKFFELDLDESIKSWLNDSIAKIRKTVDRHKQLKNSPFEVKVDGIKKTFYNEAFRLVDNGATEDAAIQLEFNKLFNKVLVQANHEERKQLGSFNTIIEEVWTANESILNTAIEGKKGKINSEIIDLKMRLRKDLKNSSTYEITSTHHHLDYLKFEKNNITYRRFAMSSRPVDQAKKKLENLLSEAKKSSLDAITSASFDSSTRIFNIMNEASAQLKSEIVPGDDRYFTEEFQSRYLVFIFGLTIKRFATYEETIRQKQSVKLYLDNNKQALLGDFKKTCTSGANDVEFAHTLTMDVLKRAIIDEVKRNYGKKVLFDEIINMDCFRTKHEMMLCMQTKMLSMNDVKKVVQFSNSFDNFAKEWIAKEAVDHAIQNEWFTKKLQDFFSRNVKFVLEALDDTSSSSEPKEWWETLKVNLRQKLVIQVSLHKTAFWVNSVK